MTLRVKLEIAAAALVLLLGGIGLNAYITERENRIRAEATTEAQQSVQKQLAQQVSDLARQMAARDATYQQELQTLSQKFSSAATPAQVASLASQLMALKQPIQIIQPQPTTENPHPEPVAVVPQSDFPQAKSYIQECETCKLQLPKLQADLVDRQKQAELAQQQIDSLKKEKTSLQTALKGGTWIQRSKHDIKIGVIGGGIAIVVACALGHCPK